MIRRQRLQEQVTTGNATLPVVIVFTLVWWFFHKESSTSWTEMGLSYGWMCLNAFLLALLNNRFSLIRSHTRFHVTLFLLMTTTLMSTNLSWGQASLTALLLANYRLFKSYQRIEPVGEIFTGFLFVGIVSVFFPPILYFVPMFYIGMQMFQSLTCRTFFAGLAGLCLPYWLLLVYLTSHAQWEWFAEWASRLTPVTEISWGVWSGTRLGALGWLVFLSVIGAFHCLSNSYADKIRTRFFLTYLVMLQVYALAFILLPSYFEMLFPIAISQAAIFGGHLFALTHTKGSNLLFVLLMLSWIAYLIYALWNS